MKTDAIVAKRRDVKLKFNLPPMESTTKTINFQVPYEKVARQPGASMPPPRGSVTERLVKTTVELPHHLWRAVKVRAMDDGSDLRGVIIEALQQYLAKKGARGEK